MSTMKLKVLSKTGQTLMTCNEDTEVSLVYTAPYQPGDFIALTLDHPGQYCVVQFEDTMQPVLAYIAKPEVCFTIPTGEQALPIAQELYRQPPCHPGTVCHPGGDRPAAQPGV